MKTLGTVAVAILAVASVPAPFAGRVIPTSCRATSGRWPSSRTDGRQKSHLIHADWDAANVAAAPVSLVVAGGKKALSHNAALPRWPFQAGITVFDFRPGLPEILFLAPGAGNTAAPRGPPSISF